MVWVGIIKYILFYYLFCFKLDKIFRIFEVKFMYFNLIEIISIFLFFNYGNIVINVNIINWFLFVNKWFLSCEF